MAFFFLFFFGYLSLRPAAIAPSKGVLGCVFTTSHWFKHALLGTRGGVVIYYPGFVKLGLSRPVFTSSQCLEFPISTTFAPRLPYMNMAPKNDYLWEGLLPANGGFIYTPDGNVGVSMFHQLHCLKNLRTALQGLQYPEQSQMHHDHSQEGNRSHPIGMHWTHCLDYLRQVSFYLTHEPWYRLTNSLTEYSLHGRRY